MKSFGESIEQIIPDSWQDLFSGMLVSILQQSENFIQLLHFTELKHEDVI
jgi:hypothetical protein